MPAEQAQIRLMTASPVTLHALIPAPDQVTPEQAYFSDLNFYKKTLFHTPFLSRRRAITLNEYKSVQILLEVDAWFNTLPSAVQRYLLPLQSQYTKWFNENVRDLQQNYAWCKWCKQKSANLQRHFMQHHARWRTIWFCPLPSSSPNKENLVKHLQSKQHAKGMDVTRARALAKEIVQQNCFWPVSQTFADKLLRTSKRLIRYVALYSMAGVAMEGRMFRIPSSSMDIGFIDACTAHLTPKMALSQVLPSGANLRRVAIEPRPTSSPTQRPSASTYRDDENVAEVSALKMGLVTPLFQPLRGETGRTWFTNEYGITPDTSSLMSSESATEREDYDEEILSFDLGPEPYDPVFQERLPSDEWLDDLQQGLIPLGSEPKIMEYDPETHEMPVMPSLIDTMRQDISPEVETWTTAPMSPERASTPTIGFSYDYTTDEPPTIQRIGGAPTHSSPHPDPPQLRACPGPALLAPRLCSTSVPPTPTMVKRMATHYMPVTESVTPPISPVRVAEIDPATPLPIYRPGKGRGRGKWRSQETKDVGAKRKTKPAETQATQAQASRASWPEPRDHSLQITHLARDLQLRDTSEDRFTDIQRNLTAYKIDENKNEVRPPAAGIHSHQQNVYFIPPPRAGGGAMGVSTPVSTVPLGLIHHVDPLLATQLREDPASLAVRDTRLRVLSTMRLVRTGLLGQLAALQQWEEALHSQGGQ